MSDELDAVVESLSIKYRIWGILFLFSASVLLVLDAGIGISGLFGGAGIGLAMAWFAMESMT